MASLCFAAVQCGLEDVLSQGVAGLQEIETGMGHIGGLIIPGLTGLVNGPVGTVSDIASKVPGGGIRGGGLRED